MNTLIVGQFGGPTPVINASLAGLIRAAQQQSPIRRIYGLKQGIEGAIHENLLDLTHENDGTLTRLVETPAAILGSSRHKISPADFERILTVFQAHHVRYFAAIGGNGTMYVCQRLAEFAAAQGYDLQVIGIPKTIDNDLAGTDHAPGYGSAARFMALAARDTGRDLESMTTFDDVTILEALGRNAGWLAAATALGKNSEDEAPHLIYLPELPFDEGQFLDDVANVHARLGRVFIVVGEGLRDAAGNFVGQSRPSSLPSGKIEGERTDAVGRVIHSLSNGVAAYLTEVVRTRLQLQARFLRPSLISRAMSHCVALTDQAEAYRVGEFAVEQFMQGQSQIMVKLERVSTTPYQCDVGVSPLSEVASTEKGMPRSFINQAGTMVTPKFMAYAMPLIGGPLPPLARLSAGLVARRVLG